MSVISALHRTERNKPVLMSKPIVCNLILMSMDKQRQRAENFNAKSKFEVQMCKYIQTQITVLPHMGCVGASQNLAAECSPQSISPAIATEC